MSRKEELEYIIKSLFAALHLEASIHQIPNKEFCSLLIKLNNATTELNSLIEKEV
jgi:hypothetical protein